MDDNLRTFDYVTLEEIRATACVPTKSQIDRRAQAALVFLFLAGMRNSAFVSLPIEGLDLSERTILQFPRLGVQTKNRQPAITYLLDIPDLLEIVQDWDREIRSILPPNGLWFALISAWTKEIDTDVDEIGEMRPWIARRAFRRWLKRAGLPHHPPTNSGAGIYALD